MTHLVLPAVHSLTGCDITSEVGTKKVGLRAKPDTFLYFTDPHSVHYSKGWALLGRCFEKGSECTTFTDPQADMFHFSKAGLINNLPPTSEGLLPHIKHAFYDAYTTMHALEIHINPETTEVLDPEEFGFELIPATSWKALNPHWSVFCSCSKCANINCSYRMARVECVKFCKWRKTSSISCGNVVV